MKKTLEAIASAVIAEYIGEHYIDLAERIIDGETDITIRAFYRAEDGEWEATDWDEPTEEGDWVEVDSVDTDDIAEEESVAEYIAEWEAETEARRDPYAYYGVSPWDFA